MMWWIVVVTSAGLIALGVFLLLRDFLKPSAGASKRVTAPAAAGRAKSKMSPFARVVAAAMPKGVNGEAGATLGKSRPTDIDVMPPAAVPAAPRLTSLEKHWPRLKPEVEAAMASVNQTLAPLAVAIGAPGEATWSLHNQGFGDYRRVLIDNESVAWLRLEVGADMRITARLRAHEAEGAGVNRDCVAPARRAAGQLAQTVSECLSALFEYAVWRHSNNLKNNTVRTPGPAQTPTHPLTAPQRRSEMAATATPSPAAAPPAAQTTSPVGMQPPAASPTAVMVDAAIMLVNRAFSEAGAELVTDVAHAEQSGPAENRALSINAGGVSVGLMLIEPRGDRIDISVGVADLVNFQAARRQSQPLAGATVHSLAEAIATNAWPAIAIASQRAAVA